MKYRRLFSAVSATAAIAALFVFSLCVSPVSVKTSLYDLIGAQGESIPPQVRDLSSANVPVLVASGDFGAALEAARLLEGRLPLDCFKSVRFRFDAEIIEERIAFCAANSSGLVSAKDGVLLKTASGRASLARRSVRQASGILGPGYFSPDEDPFSLTHSFFNERISGLSGHSSFAPRSGFLAAELDNRHYILLAAELRDEVSEDIDALIAFDERLSQAAESVEAAVPGVSVMPSGVPLHSARAASACKREITILGFLSTAFIIGLSLFAFRSPRSLLLVCFLFLFSLLSGGCALVLFFPEVHMLSLVFATTILGLVIDYAYHWFLRRKDNEPGVLKSLAASWLTTEISLVPLFLSSIPVLRQSAVFLGAALFAGLAAVVFFFPSRPLEESPLFRRIKPPIITFRIFAVLSVLVAFVGIWTVNFATEADALYSPRAELLEAEVVLARLGGFDKGERGMLVVGGSSSLEELLEKEESLGLPDDAMCLSKFMPSYRRRSEDYANVKLLHVEQSRYVSDALGIIVKTPPPPRPWRWEDVPEELKRVFVRGDSLVVPSVALRAAPRAEGVAFCRPKTLIEGILDVWTRETLVRLLASLCVLAVVLWVVFGKRMIAVVSPTIVGIFAVLGILALAGKDITLFHLLALFLLMGMGIDYAIFLTSKEENAFRSTTLALLTSLVGFASLAFVSFPVVRAFGTSLGIGLPVVYCTAHLFVRAKDNTEPGATTGGLSLIWAIYRVCGLRVFHFFAYATGVVVWLFSPTVRKHSPRIAKTVNFARSLADKMVVMAGGADAPKVVLERGGDAESFMGDVAGRKGVFVISTHVGTIEVLAGYGDCASVFHAWMEFSRTGVFNEFYLKHQRKNKVMIHPISEFGVETVFFAGDRLDEGEVVLMAGDRSFGRVRTEKIGEREVKLAEGVFRLAASLGHRVYLVACVASGPVEYTAKVKRLPDGSASLMSHAYAEELLRLKDAYPMQDYSWDA